MSYIINYFQAHLLFFKRNVPDDVMKKGLSGVVSFYFLNIIVWVLALSLILGVYLFKIQKVEYFGQ